MVDLTQNPLQNAESLLQQARQDRRRTDRNNTTGMLFNLAGQVIGNVMQGKQEEKYNRFMNQESVLAERALVRSAVDKSSALAEKARAANAHAGGKSAYFLDDFTGQLTGYLNAQLGKDGKPYNQQDVDRMAKQLASENLETYINAFDTQLTAAQNVLSTTGTDRLAYAKALRDASGVDVGVLGRTIRKATSFFLDPEDRDTGRALNKTTTASAIYNASENFKNTYDKYYNETGSSLVASIVAEKLEKGGLRDQIREMRATPQFESLNLDGMGARDYLVLRGVPQPGEEKGAFINAFDPVYEEYISLEGAAGNSTATRRAKMIDKDRADDDLARISQAGPELSKQMMGLALRGIDTSGNDKAPQDVIDNAMRRAATDIHFYERGLRRDFGDMQITPEQLTRIATRAYIIDREINNGRSRMYSVERKHGGTNPLLNYLALKAETEDDLSVLDPRLEDTAKEEINEYLTVTLPNQSPYRAQEVYNIVNKNSGLFGGDYNFNDLSFKRGNQKISVQDLVAEAVILATTEGPYAMPQVKNPFYFIEVTEEKKEELKRKHMAITPQGGFKEPSAQYLQEFLSGGD